jgi:hypothetical protein
MKLTCAVVVSLFAMANLLNAKPVTIPNETATLDIPDAWTVKPTPVAASATPAAILAATAPDNNTAVEVIVLDNSDGITTDSASFIEGEQKGLTKTVTAAGGTIQMGATSTLTLGGVPASCLIYTQTAAGGKPVSSHTYNVAANGKMYMFVMQSVDGAQDAALATIINSLAFSSPPVVPAPRADIQAEKIGQLVGYAVGALGAIVVIRWIVRRRKTA